MAIKKIEIRPKGTGDYVDTLYPKTSTDMVIDEATGTTVAVHMADYVKHPGVATTTNVDNAYAVTLNPAPVAYVSGMGLVATANADSTGSATVNVNGLGAVPIKKANGNNVTNLKNGGVYTLRYSNSSFILQGEGGGGGYATGTVTSSSASKSYTLHTGASTNFFYATIDITTLNFVPSIIHFYGSNKLSTVTVVWKKDNFYVNGAVTGNHAYSGNLMNIPYINSVMEFPVPGPSVGITYEAWEKEV